MLDVIRNNPFGTVFAAFFAILFCIAAFVIGAIILTWIIKGITWLIPKADYAVWLAIDKLRGI